MWYGGTFLVLRGGEFEISHVAGQEGGGDFWVIQKRNLTLYLKQGNKSRVQGKVGGGDVGSIFKSETFLRIFEHENSKCKLQTETYYGDFGILQKTKFFGFIFMKLQFRCKNHASYLNFASTLMKLSENFRLHYIQIVFDAIILGRFFPLMKLFTVFFTVSFFFSSFTFLWN